MPIVNLLDSYKVYHEVDPRLWKSLVQLASLVMFFGFFATEVLATRYSLLVRTRPGTRARSHTPPVRPPCIHLPLSPSVVGLGSLNVHFPPGLLCVFWTLRSVCFLFLLVVAEPRPQTWLKNQKEDPPSLPKKSKRLTFSHAAPSIGALMDRASAVLR